MSISDFGPAMIHTITVKALSTEDAYGARTYGAGTDYSARVVYASKWIRLKDGSEILSKSHVWILGSPTIAPNAQITLPDSTTPPILLTEKFSDENGFHHTKVYFG